MNSRRRFIKFSALTASSVFLPWGCNSNKSTINTTPSPPLDPTTIPQFKDPLPIPKTLESTGTSGNTTLYQSTMTEFKQQVLPEGMPSTTVWGFEGSFPGPTIEARRDEAVSVKWINELPTTHLFGIDTTIHGSGSDQPEVRTVVHLHGAHATPENDGYPEDWYTSDQVDNSLTYVYQNDQEPATLWYHDHAMGNTRLNVYAGLAGVYTIRDDIEEGLNLPSGDYEIPLVIQDRFFTEDGELFYPTVSSIATAPTPSIVPQLAADVIVVNGKAWPYLEVEPRKYRFRVVNGSNGRPYRLQVIPDTAPNTSVPYFQIGTDGGLLASSVPVGKRAADGRPQGPQVTVAPGERADIIVDFSNFTAGDEFTLANINIPDFPRRDPATSGRILKFKVVASTGVDSSLVLPAPIRPVPSIDPADSVLTRNLTLDEITDEYGRQKFLLNNAKWTDPVTETPQLNTTEIWNFINTSSMGHPMHLHQVTFGVLSRKLFDLEHYNQTGEIVFTSPNMIPPNEKGQRDMVRVPQGSVVQIIAHFDIPGKFVWHCHLLDHEDHEMMRPYEVIT